MFGLGGGVQHFFSPSLAFDGGVELGFGKLDDLEEDWTRVRKLRHWRLGRVSAGARVQRQSDAARPRYDVAWAESARR